MSVGTDQDDVQAIIQEIRESITSVESKLHFHTVQWILIVMFSGVIFIGTWHGYKIEKQIRSNERQTTAIIELTGVIRENNRGK